MHPHPTYLSTSDSSNLLIEPVLLNDLITEFLLFTAMMERAKGCYQCAAL